MRVVGGVLQRHGTVLVCRRARNRASGGLWEFPGGKVEPGESDQAALARELREELQIDAEVGALLDVSTTEVGALSIELACYLVASPSEPTIGEDHDELRWVPLQLLPSLAWAPADLPAVTAIGRDRLRPGYRKPGAVADDEDDPEPGEQRD